jgi:hypothetical protein
LILEGGVDDQLWRLVVSSSESSPLDILPFLVLDESAVDRFVVHIEGKADFFRHESVLFI